MATESSNPRKRAHPNTSTDPPQTFSSKRTRPNPTPHSKPTLNPKTDPKSTKPPTKPKAPRTPHPEPPTPINPLKRRIRSLTRLLQNPSTSSSLPATTLQAHERELKHLRSELVEAETVHATKEEEKKRSQMIGRYHKVRFFERRKAGRRLKQLRKEAIVDGDGEEGGHDGGRLGAELGGRLREAEVDLQYTMYAPLMETYVSLFAGDGEGEGDGGTAGDGDGEREGSGTEDGEAQEQQKKPAVWYEIARAMDRGQEALEALRERRPAASATASTPAAANGTGKRDEREHVPGGEKREKKRKRDGNVVNGAGEQRKESRQQAAKRVHPPKAEDGEDEDEDDQMGLSFFERMDE